MSCLWNPFNCDLLDDKKGCLQGFKNCQYAEECKDNFINAKLGPSVEQDDEGDILDESNGLHDDPYWEYCMGDGLDYEW